MTYNKKYKYCGIYKIQIGKYNYIGQSQDITKRISYHQRDLVKNKHGNNYMQNVFNKYKTLEYKILFKCKKEFLTILEQVCINYYSKNNLNLAPAGKYFTEKHKQNISNSLKNSEKAKKSLQNCIKIRIQNYKGPSEKQLQASRNAVKSMHTAEARKKSVESRLKSDKFKEARKNAGKKMVGNSYALGKTNGIRNGNADLSKYVFQNKKTQEIFVCTRYELANLISKTSYALSNLVVGKEKSAYGYILLACPLLK